MVVDVFSNSALLGDEKRNINFQLRFFHNLEILQGVSHFYIFYFVLIIVLTNVFAVFVPIHDFR
jgi:hypothetical protein